MGETIDPKMVRLIREAEGYYELDLFEDAMERTDTLLRKGVEEEFALAMKADCLRSLERYAEGVPVYEEFIRRSPQNVAAYVGLGWCLKRIGRLDLALLAMERLLEVEPAEGIGLYNLACYCAIGGERDRALGLLDAAIRQDPEYRGLAEAEEDFASIREDPAFRQMLDG